MKALPSRRSLGAGLAAVAAAVVLLRPLVPWPSAPAHYGRISPFLAVCLAAAGGVLGIGGIVGLIVALTCLFRRRWFCRRLCPLGFLLERVSALHPAGVRRGLRLPLLGRYLAALTLLAALAGYPWLLWMDPLAVFSGGLGLLGSAGRAGLFSGAVFALLLVSAAAAGPFWCRSLCPSGGVQDLVHGAREMVRRRPDRSPPGAGERIAWMRRALLLAGTGVGLAFLGKTAARSRGENAPLRPPGAIAEEGFTGRCVRCGACIRACPSKVIRPDRMSAGLSGMLAPVLSFGPGWCLEGCTLCMDACPSGALSGLDPRQKRMYRIGEALVDGDLCWLVLGRSDCNACARSCPYGAVRVVWDEDLYLAYPLVSPEKCNGCGACEAVCPARNPGAIRVWRRAEPEASA